MGMNRSFVAVDRQSLHFVIQFRGNGDCNTLAHRVLLGRGESFNRRLGEVAESDNTAGHDCCTVHIGGAFGVGQFAPLQHHLGVILGAHGSGAGVQMGSVPVDVGWLLSVALVVADLEACLGGVVVF